MKKLLLLNCALFFLIVNLAKAQIIPILDTTFNCPLSGGYSILDIQKMPDGNLLVVGGNQSVSFGLFNSIHLLDPNGHLINSLDFSDTQMAATAAALQPDGKILLLYSMVLDSIPSLDTIWHLKRFHQDLTPDNNFIPDQLVNLSDISSCMKVSNTGEIFILNLSPKVPGKPRLIKLHPNGKIDSTFHNVMYTQLLNQPTFLTTNFEILNNGNLLLQTYYQEYYRKVLVLKPSGEEDTTADAFVANAGLQCIIKLRNGKIVGFDPTLNSEFLPGFPYYTSRFMRFNVDGTRDLGFSTGISPEVESYNFGDVRFMTEDDEGRIIISSMEKITRLNPNGSIDHTFSLSQIVEPLHHYGIVANQQGRGLLFSTWNNVIGGLRRFGYNPTPGAINPTLNYIEGTVFRNLNNNCTQELGEKPLVFRWLQTQPGNYWTCSDEGGRFSIMAGTGSYVTKQKPKQFPFMGENQFCPGTLGSIVDFGSQQNITSSNNNFANSQIECPFLTVSVGSERRRRCFRNNTRIQVSNVGLATSPSGSLVHLRLPKYVKFISASQAFTYNHIDSTFTFELDSLSKGQQKIIQIVDSVSCISGLLGVEQCTKTWITPGNTCVPNPANWDGVNLNVSATCFNGKPRFKIENIGSAMPGGRIYSIYIDSMLAYTNMFQLASNFSMVVTVPQATPSQTVRLEVSQSANHPTSTFSAASINCSTGLSVPGGGFFPNSDESPVEAISCAPIRDSFDPNEKVVYPKGSSFFGNVLPGRPFNYTIRFQNKGNDSAFSVVVVDSIDAGFNPATMEMGVCSHPFKLKIGGMGRPVFTWVFEGINLPDSASNEAKSHGYINFQIRPYDSLALGTQLQNFADIYFDFNDPVRTNTTLNTLFIPSITPGLIDSVEVFTPVKSGLSTNDIRLFPNPNRGKFTVEGDEKFAVRVYSLTGICLLSRPEERKHSLDFRNFGSGMYLIETENQRGRMVQKVVVE